MEKQFLAFFYFIFAKILFKRNEEMDYMLEVEKFGKIVSHYLTELDIKLHDKYENRIILIYNVLEHDYLIFL
jgi:hypothetical protein